MNDDRAIELLVTRMLQAVDRLDWSVARDTFDDVVDVDYSAVFGAPPEQLPADVLIEGWRGLMPGFDATQHLTGPIVSTLWNDGTATAETHVRAYHYINGAPEGSWTLAGHYVMTARQRPAGWKLSGVRIDVYRQEGNPRLPALASERVKAGKARVAAPGALAAANS